jgi:ABC-type Zn uptake system ZnuABC Zn-binding protein ZnuA
VPLLPLLALGFAQEPLRVVATIPDLADLVRIIGADQVEVETLVPPGADPHAVLPKASLLLKLQRADGLACMGLDYEHAFLPTLLEKARNDAIRPGGAGWCCAAERIQPLEVPATLDRGQGADLHPRGNPHYNLDPERGRLMAASVRDLLARLRPERCEDFEARWQAWDEDARARIRAWTARLAPLRGKPIATYHRSWSYFADRFGLVLAGEVEPLPGLAPTAAHLHELKRILAERDVRVLLMEPWYSERALGKLLDGAPTRIVKSATTCGLGAGNEHYLDFLGALVEQIAAAHGLPAESP